MWNAMGTRLASFILLLVVVVVNGFPGMKENECTFKCVTGLMPFPVPEDRPVPIIEGCSCTEVRRFLLGTNFQIRGTGYQHSHCPYAHKWAHLDGHDEL